MKQLLVLAFAIGCSGKQSTPPTNETPTQSPVQQQAPTTTTMSAEECTKQGGEVRGDIGDGKIACAEGERQLGRVPVGIEGSICCARSPAASGATQAP